jgi:hypothetical protein
LQVNQPDPQRQSILELLQMTVEQRRLGYQASSSALGRPFQLDRQAAVTRIAGRILDSATLLALLQLKPPRRGGLGHAQGGATM